MIDNIKWLGHSTIKILSNSIIYIDPYNIIDEEHDADIIFITHSHYDHFSEEDIKKCMNDDTRIVLTKDLYENALKLGFKEEDILVVLPNNKYEVEDISFSTVPAYNNLKVFHPKIKSWVGYVININGINYYVAGDTDVTQEAKQVQCDVAFLPIGGTYTMDYKEAASLTNILKPKIVVPIHYGTIVGSKDDAIKFKDTINKEIICEFLD